MLDAATGGGTFHSHRDSSASSSEVLRPRAVSEPVRDREKRPSSGWKRYERRPVGRKLPCTWRERDFGAGTTPLAGSTASSAPTDAAAAPAADAAGGELEHGADDGVDAGARSARSGRGRSTAK
jgi:hypothetical protein